MKRIDKIRAKIKQKLDERTQYQREQYLNRMQQYNRYYTGGPWLTLRNWKNNNNPICECCYKWKGIVVPTCEVHHVRPFWGGVTDAEKWQLFTDVSNLCSLCKDCHILVHKLMRKYHKIIDPRYENIFNYVPDESNDNNT